MRDDCYFAFGRYLRETFGARVAKLSIDAGFGCPNRDGRLGTGGCAYCDGRGSALRQAGALPPVADQVRAMEAKYRALGYGKFIAYFQTFTNTDAPPGRLRALWDEALAAAPDIVGLAVGTRPDCVPDPVLDLLAGYRARVRVHLELGLQSAHDATLARVNRCHGRAAFDDAARRAAARGLEVVAHVILGLPGETPAMMRETARALAALSVAGVKIHGLLVVEGTALAADWRRGAVPLPDLAAYAGWVADRVSRRLGTCWSRRRRSTNCPPRRSCTCTPNGCRSSRDSAIGRPIWGSGACSCRCGQLSG